MDERRTERINLRLDPATNTLLRTAAALEGKTLTAFLLGAARDRALRAVQAEPRQPDRRVHERMHVDI